MSDFLSELAAKSGVNVEQAKKGMGALLASLKSHLPAEGFSQLSSAVPGAEGMMAEAEKSEGSSGGGVLGAITGAAGKLLGGGGAAALVAKLNGAGFSMEQATKFLTNAVEFLRGKLPDSVLEKVSALLPAGAEKK